MTEYELAQLIKELIEAGRWLNNDITAMSKADSKTYAQHQWAQVADKAWLAVNSVERGKQ